MLRSLLLALVCLPVRAAQEFEERKLMNLRANMHNAFMQDYLREGKTTLEAAPGWLRSAGATLAAKAAMGLNRSWHFYVVQEASPEIRSTPYGTLIVHQGALDLGLTHDETGALAAQEMAHIAQDHGVQLLIAKMAQEELGEFTASEHGEKSGQIARLREIVQQLRYTLKQEAEADRLAMGMLDKAGMKPESLLSALKKIRAKPIRILAAKKYLDSVRSGRAEFELPKVSGKPEIGRPTYMRRAMDEGYDYKKPLGRKK
ncbi:MAG: M48 family metalloprotease [Elusimicrobiota bacterium]